MPRRPAGSWANSTALTPREFVGFSERQDLAVRALDCLAKLADTSGKLYDMRRVEDAVLAGLLVPRLERPRRRRAGQPRHAGEPTGPGRRGQPFRQPARRPPGGRHRLRSQRAALRSAVGQEAIRLQYARYNESDSQDLATQQVLASILSTIESRATPSVLEAAKKGAAPEKPAQPKRPDARYLQNAKTNRKRIQESRLQENAIRFPHDANSIFHRSRLARRTRAADPRPDRLGAGHAALLPARAAGGPVERLGAAAGRDGHRQGTDRQGHSPPQPAGSGPFIRVNCGALHENLLESELFGHVRGAFTGAVDNRTGRFEAAHTGTVFLDEINSTTPKLQVKLLRVLQEHEFERVGDTQTIRVDTRVIAASNRDLLEEVEAGRFREDLYYRLNVVTIYLPPLRERREDIPLLVGHFLRIYNEQNLRHVPHVQPKAMEMLCGYEWPGNVRELQNYVERAVVLAPGDELTCDLLPEAVLGAEAAADRPPAAGRTWTPWSPNWSSRASPPPARRPTTFPPRSSTAWSGS